MREEPTYWLARFLLLRLLGVVYTAAFLSAALQIVPLVGHAGLLPADRYLGQLAAHFGSTWSGFTHEPSLFWIDASDDLLVAGAWLGVVLSLVVAAGFANAIVLGVLWVLYSSYVRIGSDWYGYGWEIQLIETGFLAIFLCPLLDARPFPRRPPPRPVIWCFRWLAFRIMLGAGLIKLRGDRCWRQLTCLDFHYETQPIPNPLSRTLHFAPEWTKKGGVLFNHLTEVVAPWFLAGPRPLLLVAGALMVAFQVLLIFSGNLSFLNYLTIVPVLACFDDRALARLLPRRLVTAATLARATATPSRAQEGAAWALLALVALLSARPIMNLASGQQIMNTSFDRLDLVNTYGAFGSVGRTRDELVFEGTDGDRDDPAAEWKAYEFPCKPGDPLRRPCVVSPYQPRLAWQLWFAAMSTYDRYPWTVHLIAKLLAGDPDLLGLIERNPFPDHPPRYIRVVQYRYRFAPPADPTGAWWKRAEVAPWILPLSLDDPSLKRFLEARGWSVPRPFDSSR